MLKKLKVLGQITKDRFKEQNYYLGLKYYQVENVGFSQTSVWFKEQNSTEYSRLKKNHPSSTQKSSDSSFQLGF